MQYGPQSVPFLFVGGRDILASIVYDFDDDVESKLTETHGLGPTGAGWKASKAVGVRMASFGQRGMFDDTVDGVHDALKNQQHTQQVVGYGLNGGTYGNLFVGLQGAFGSKYNRKLSREDLHLADAVYTVSGQKDEGVILHPKTARVAAGNSEATSIDRVSEIDVVDIPIATSSIANPTTITTVVPHGLTSGDKVFIANHAGSTPAIAGEYTATVTGALTFTIPVNVSAGGAGGSVKRAMSTNGGVGYLFVPSVVLGGYTSWTLKVRHSVDNITFADLLTFTIVTVAPVAVRATIGGTVNRYLATAWSLQGAGAAPSITPVVGFSRAA